VDAVADVHDVLRSRAFRLSMTLHGIPVAFIHKGRAEKRRFIRCGSRGMEPLRHTVLRYCDTFRRLGFVFDDPEPVRRQEGVWVGFAPFSAQRGKTYPEELSREAVRLLAERYDRVFIHGGGGGEQRFAEEMERTYPNVTALFGKVGLDGEMDLIANLDCVVSMDSLVMHLAALVATPVVSVWGATHPGLGFLGYGCDPRGVLQADMSLFGLRQQALPLRRLPLSESRDPRDDRRTGPAACRTMTKRKSLRTTGGSFFAAAAVSRLWCRPFWSPRSSGCICPRRPWRSRPSR